MAWSVTHKQPFNSHSTSLPNNFQDIRVSSLVSRKCWLAPKDLSGHLSLLSRGRDASLLAPCCFYPLSLVNTASSLIEVAW